MPTATPKTIKVKSALKGNQVALWDVDPAHPGGEAFVYDETAVSVAETAAVVKALREGKIEKVGKQPAAPKADPPEAPEGDAK